MSEKCWNNNKHNNNSDNPLTSRRRDEGKMDSRSKVASYAFECQQNGRFVSLDREIKKCQCSLFFIEIHAYGLPQERWGLFLGALLNSRYIRTKRV